MKSKVCQSCGRPFEFRKKWKDNWPEVRFCSKNCQSLKAPHSFMEKIVELLGKRSPGKSICPSEILPQELKSNPLKMERVRCAARLLAHQGVIDIQQKGKTIDPNDFRGPIRLIKKK